MWKVTHEYKSGRSVEFPTTTELESLLDTLRRHKGVIGVGESFKIERIEPRRDETA